MGLHAKTSSLRDQSKQSVTSTTRAQLLPSSDFSTTKPDGAFT